MTTLVTGGLGFIGSHVTRELIEDDEKVVATRFGGKPVASFLSPAVQAQVTYTIGETPSPVRASAGSIGG